MKRVRFPVPLHFSVVVLGKEPTPMHVLLQPEQLRARQA
jgi:hypothetical protein